MKRQASVVWEGGIPGGRGLVTTRGTTLPNARRRKSGERSGDTEGTRAELIAAAFGVCFANDLTRRLGQTGFTPERINTAVVVTLERKPARWTIMSVQLNVLARVRGAKQGAFIQAALNAKDHCPISPLFKAAISMNARLIA